MSIAIEEINDGVYCVKLTIKLEDINGETSKTFQLARFLTNIIYFNVSCNYKESDSQDLTYSLTISLRQLKSVNDGSNSSKQKEVIPDNYNQPCAVWLNEGVNNKIAFQNSHEYKWGSGSIDKDEWKANATAKYQLSERFILKIFLQFNTFSLGEVNVLVKHLTDMYVKQSNCDIQFCFQGKKQIGGHVNILSARSPVFAAMFKTNMQEVKTGKVFIKDIQLDIFKELLHFIYSGRTKNSMTEETARLLFMAADKYDITGLKEECVRFLLFDLQESNAIDLLVWADLHSVENVKEAALNYVAKNYSTIFQSDEWEELTNKHPGLCLSVTRRLSSK